MNYKQGDIVFLPFPYADLSGAKKRPVVIVSHDVSPLGDIIVAKITSTLRNGRFSFPLADTDLTTPTPFKSEIQCDELFTVHESLIIRKLSSLHRQSLQGVCRLIQQNFIV